MFAIAECCSVNIVAPSTVVTRMLICVSSIQPTSLLNRKSSIYNIRSLNQMFSANFKMHDLHMIIRVNIYLGIPMNTY